MKPPLRAVFFGCCDAFSEPLREATARRTRLVATLRTAAQLPSCAAAVPAADVAVVASYGRKLPAHVLSAFPCGVLNVHPSLLPRYRGAAPAEWQLLRGERHGGVSVIRVTERMDAGPLLAAAPFALEEHCTREELLHTAAVHGVQLLEGLLGDEARLRSAGMEQEEMQASGAPKVTRALATVQWETWDVAQFWRHFRALAGRFGGLQVAPAIKVVHVGTPVRGPPPVRRFSGRLNHIAAPLRDGWVPLKRFSVAGAAAPMDARDLWNGHRSAALAMGCSAHS